MNGNEQANMGKEEKDCLPEKERLKSTAKKEKAAADYSKKDEQKMESKMTDEENNIPQAMTTLERQTNRSGALSVPGAHAIRGPGMADRSSDASSCSLTSTTASRDGQHPTGLPDHHAGPVLTATLVEEDDVPRSSSQDHDSTVFHVLQASSPPLARAEPADDSLLSDMEAAIANLDMSLQRNEETKQPSPSEPKFKKRWIYFLLVLSLMIISGLTVALVFALRDDPPKGPPPDDEKTFGDDIGRNIGGNNGGKNGGNDYKVKPDGGRFN